MNVKEKRKQDALAAFGDLIDIIDTLRSPEGCPWDRRQTPQTLKPYLIEEAYEVLDAIDEGVPDLIREELGDVLLQIMLHSQIAFEGEDFHIGDVIRHLSEKMVERHPHVFSGVAVSGEAEVLTNWESIKAQGRAAQKKGMLDGVPKALPALLKAFRMGQKVGRVGFDWPDTESVRNKVSEELAELDDAVRQGNPAHMAEELGDVLFAVAQWARHLDIDPEEALAACCSKFKKRFEFVEAKAAESGASVGDCSIETLELFWEQAKQYERTGRSESD